MKTKLTKLSCLILVGVLLVSVLASCGLGELGGIGAGTGDKESNEVDTQDEAQVALDALGEIDWGGEEFAVLFNGMFKGEVFGENETVDKEGSASQVINDAVYERNSLLEDRCNLVWATVEKDDASMGTAISNEAAAPTGDFQFIDHRLNECANAATNGYLYNLYDLGVNLEGEWWDSGTAQFVLAGGVYFMSGSLNYADDGVTYVLIFNKDMRKTYNATVPDPYQTARDGEWTLDYFYNVIQGISADNGDGKWDENDTYGFINTWEYGNTFFIGSDLRYIDNTDADEVKLVLSDRAQMEKALEVLELSQAIYHNNNASYMSPPGQEGLGQTAFKENRGLFYGEVVNHLTPLVQEMDSEFGILPVPKYDKAQEFYRTWTHSSGSSFAVTTAIPEGKAETVGQILSAYALLSHQYLKPAYYDVTLTSRNIHDSESAEMMDLMFSNRVYEMSFYFTANFGFFELFKTATNDNSDSFSSKYSGNAKNFEKKLAMVLRKLEKK